MKRRRVVISDSSSSDNDEGDDLDKELLTLATRNKRNQPPQATAIKNGKGNAKPDSDSDTSDSGEEWGDRKKPQRKKTAAAPVGKKSKAVVSSSSSGGSEEEEYDNEHNSEPEEGEVTSDESSGEEFDDGYDEELMGDAEDKAKLEDMTEKEREQVLYERMERREAMKTRWGIKRKLKKENKKQKAKKKVDLAAAAKKATTSSRQQRTAEKRTEGKKAQAIQDLKAKREEKKQRQEQKQQKEGDDKVDDGGGDDESAADGTEGDGEEGKREEAVKKQPLKASDIYSDDDDDDDDSKSNASSRTSKSSSDSDSDTAAGTGRGHKSKPIEYINNVNQLNKIRLSRHKLEKWCHAHFFKNLVIGCFVRVGIGQNMGRSVYRACAIVDVVETAKIYHVGNNRTNKGLKLKFGKAERVFRLEFISNDNVTDSEFCKLQYENDMADIPMPTVEFVQQKVADIRQYATYKLTDQDVEHIVREKGRFRQAPFNYASRKADLLQQKVEAEIVGDMEMIRRIEGELQDLDSRASELDRVRNENTFNVIYINKKNRLRNNMETEKAMLREAKEARQQKQDPFTRRKCQPMMVKTVAEGGGKAAKPGQDTVDSSKPASQIEKSPAQATASTSKEEEDVASMIAKGADLPSRKKQAAAPAKLTNSVYAKKSSHSLSQAAATHPHSTGDTSAYPRNAIVGAGGGVGRGTPATDLSAVHSFDLDIPLKFDLNLQPPKVQPQEVGVKVTPTLSGPTAARATPHHGLNLDDFKRRKGLI